MKVFSRIGIFYAIGDYLEMLSMGGLDGAAYQAAMQSVSPEAVFDSSRSCAAAVVQVISSCFSAVTADTALKAFKELPLYIQLSQLFLSWGIVSVILTVFFEPAVLFSATTFFAGWNIGRVLVVTSFAVKTVITMTLLKVLDSVMKIIGEAVAVLVIYMAHVCGDSVIFHEANPSRSTANLSTCARPRLTRKQARHLMGSWSACQIWTLWMRSPSLRACGEQHVEEVFRR